ncbi:hypothetical protein G6F35_013724 [Rhizopus arrhizus]|nr:hypothetical protein G6F35_013724 [Rhizopus arrhizus]
MEARRVHPPDQVRGLFEPGRQARRLHRFEASVGGRSALHDRAGRLHGQGRLAARQHRHHRRRVQQRRAGAARHPEREGGLRAGDEHDGAAAADQGPGTVQPEDAPGPGPRHRLQAIGRSRHGRPGPAQQFHRAAGLALP